MQGRVDNCDVTVRYRTNRGDEDRSPTTEYLVKATTGQMPVDLVRPRIFKWTWSRSRSFHSADPEWGRQFVVRTEDHDAAHLFLTSDRRAVFDHIRLKLGNYWKFSERGLRFSMSRRARGENVVETVQTLISYVTGITTGQIRSN
jgi:hypothetical protein